MKTRAGLSLLIFAIFIPLAVEAGGVLFLSPLEKNIAVGDEFTVTMKISTDISINTTKTSLCFSQDKLVVTDLLKENSILSLWTSEPKYSNEAGTLSFSGGLPSPGFIGKSGELISIKFKAKSKGIAEVKFCENILLANDGKGTDVFDSAEGGSYTINEPAPIISSSTHPNQERWYSNNEVQLSWELNSTITDVSFLLDQNRFSVPDIISEGTPTFQVFEGLEDGIWYFHLRTKNNSDWSSTRHFVIRVDTMPPDSFEVTVNNEGDATNPSPVLYFKTEDETSGLDSYKIELETGEIIILTDSLINEFQLPIHGPGLHPVIVQAIDKAGNHRENVAGVVIKPIKEPIITIWPKTYVAGEEKFYVEGMALPKTKVTIFLEKESNISKRWQISTNDRGEWALMTADLLRSGAYNLFSQAEDERGASSEFSPKQEIEVTFSGIALGPLWMTFRGLVSALSIVLLVLIVLTIHLTQKNMRKRKKLKKEIGEAEESLHKGFAELKKGVTKKRLTEIEGSIEKEIEDVEKELK